VDLTLAGAGAGGGGPPASVTATTGHRFYSVDRGDWVPAVELKPGETLRDASGDEVTVVRLAERNATTTVYNLTVDSEHTYYVLAGDSAVLVHNCQNPGTRFDVPDTSGVYTIHLKDGRKYVGSSTDSMRTRVNKSMRKKHAVKKAGYKKEDVVNVTWIELPPNMDSEMVRRVEQTVMEGLKARGVKLVNLRDPEIRIPFGGYF
jgi:hypothetical protein